MRLHVSNRGASVSLGPVGMLLYVIGAVFYAIAVAVIWLVAALIVLGAYVTKRVKERRARASDGP